MRGSALASVNIVTSDRGWVLEKLAGELARRLPYVTLGEGPDRDAAIQYYMTYACRRRRLSPVELAYFAHMEPDPPTRAHFFAAAREVEHCVCHARPYEAMLREAGVAQVSTIPPGVDLDTFRPKLRVGVVGRTYHTGRKGEHLVAAVMDIPEIEWSFTGEGWPGPALNLPPEALPDFYRGQDYVLVPALYEGGPMCVVEALACGTEVIAPAIGWVPDYPHVEYRVGDAEDLRRVLLGLVEKKRALRESVAARSWDSWAEGHDRLFRDLAAAHGLTLAPPPRPARPKRPKRPGRIGLFLHGSEGQAQGGPSVRAPRLARELTDWGCPAELRVHPDPRGFEGLDLVHVFNTWPPWSAPDLMRKARASGRALVLSPIFLDHGARALWEDRLPRAFAENAPGEALEDALAALRAEAPPEAGEEPSPGFHAAVREMCALADRLVLLGETERARLARIGARTEHGRVVLNPVDAALFGQADPALFEQATGLRDVVLCLARLEPRKNQLMLVQALRETGLPLVLVGHGDNRAYRALLEKHRAGNVHILDRLEPNSPLLAAACAAARVAVLPSWSEGVPLAALEAAAAGAALVLSEQSGAREHLAEFSRGCDAGDLASIRAAVLEAWETRRDRDAIAAQKSAIAERFGWDRHRVATEAVHAEALAAAFARGAAPPRPLPAPAPPAEWRPLPVVMDVTTGANHRGRWTGIARVEAALARALAEDPRADLRLVAWNGPARCFVEMPEAALRAGRLAEELARHDTAPRPVRDLPAGAPLLVAGSAWMQNPLHAESLVGFARSTGLRLTPLIHDVIPTRHPYWYDEGYAPVFEHALTLLLDGADALLAVSEATRREVEAFALRTPGLLLPPIGVLREGDGIFPDEAAADPAGPPVAAELAGLPFVLSVGAIHARKNHRLLHDAWLRLAERMGERCPHLVIVGGVAWNGADVARALRGDARLAGRVRILEDVDDDALAWLYANCLFTAYPSLDEGWGLPVAESLRHGKLCLAADIPSVREIAPGLVELLDPRNPLAWTAKLHFYAASRAARAQAEARIAAGYRGVSWGRSAAMLLDLLAAPPPRPKRAYTPGAVLPLADRLAAARHRGAGWHAVEAWGCWAAEARAELVFEPAIPIGEDALFLAELRAAAPGLSARILANGTEVARWDLGDGAPRPLQAVIPAAIAAQAERILIAIETDRLIPAGGEDPRQVGAGLSLASLAPLSSVGDAARHLGVAALPAEALPLGHRCHLLADGTGHGMLAGDWTARPGWGLTAAAPAPRLALLLPGRPGREVEIALRLRPVATAAAPLRLRALLAGTEAAAWDFAGDSPVEVVLPVPAALRSRADPLVLDLVPEPPRAPAALGLGAAEEAFGFGLIAIEARAPGQPSPAVRLPVSAGAPLRLAAGGLGPAALGPDWHAPEAEACWSFGLEAALPLRLARPLREGARLSLDLESFRATRLELRAATLPLATAALVPGASQRLDVAVPAAAIGPAGELDLVFTLDAAPSPFAAAAGADERPLGLRLARLAAVPEGGPRRAEYDAASAADLAALQPEGWYEAEPGGRWSRAEGATLRLQRPAGGATRLRLDLAGRVYGTAVNGPARVDLRLDDATAAFLVFPDDAARPHSVTLDCTESGPEVVIGFRRPGAVSPAEAGEGTDDRRLGLMLRNLCVLWE